MIYQMMPKTEFKRIKKSKRQPQKNNINIVYNWLMYINIIKLNSQ